MSKSKRIIKVGAIILAIIIVIGLSVGGLYFSKDHSVKSPTSDNAFYLEPQDHSIATNTGVLGEQTQTPSQTGVKNYSNADLHFSIDIPSSWVVSSTNDEVTIEASPKQRFNIQVFSTQGNDLDALKNFLSTQPKLHNVASAEIAGHQGFVFAIDGPFIYGYAFLDNNRLYYLLGDDIDTSAIAKTFKTF